MEVDIGAVRTASRDRLYGWASASALKTYVGYSAQPQIPAQVPNYAGSNLVSLLVLLSHDSFSTVESRPCSIA